MERPFLRDVSFYLMAGFWAFYIFWRGQIRSIPFPANVPLILFCLGTFFCRNCLFRSQIMIRLKLLHQDQDPQPCLTRRDFWVSTSSTFSSSTLSLDPYGGVLVLDPDDLDPRSGVIDPDSSFLDPDWSFLAGSFTTVSRSDQTSHIRPDPQLC